MFKTKDQNYPSPSTNKLKHRTQRNQTYGTRFNKKKFSLPVFSSFRWLKQQVQQEKRFFMYQ